MVVVKRLLSYAAWPAYHQLSARIWTRHKACAPVPAPLGCPGTTLPALPEHVQRHTSQYAFSENWDTVLLFFGVKCSPGRCAIYTEIWPKNLAGWPAGPGPGICPAADCGVLGLLLQLLSPSRFALGSQPPYPPKSASLLPFQRWRSICYNAGQVPCAELHPKNSIQNRLFGLAAPERNSCASRLLASAD
jgi:hypothetical protein